MKKIIFEVLFYVLSVLIQIIPVIVAYEGNMLVSPLSFQIIVPFYLLAGSIYFSEKHNLVVNIWRVIPCVVSLLISYCFIINYIEDYFLRTSGYAPDFWTYLILKYFYIISTVIVVAGIVIHQVINIIKYFYRRSKASETKVEN